MITFSWSHCPNHSHKGSFSVNSKLIVTQTGDPNIRIWKDQNRTELLQEGAGTCWLSHSCGAPGNVSVYAEGFKEGSSGILTFELNHPAPCPPTIRTREYRVLTPYWKGFEIKKKWQTSAKMHAVKIVGDDRYGNVSNGSIRTQYPDIVIGEGYGSPNPAIPGTIFGKRGGGGSGESDNAKSVKTFPNGFTLELEYEYDPVGDDLSKCPPLLVVPGGYGYVPIKNGNAYPHKLSFVANSGVKFGGIEVAILDVASMVKIVGGTGQNAIDAFKYVSPSQGIQNNGNVEGLSNSSITGTAKFATEHVTTLMSHVIYRGEPGKMQDYLDASDKLDPADPDEPRADWKKWWNTLKNNWKRHSTKMKIKVSESNVGGFDVEIWRWNNATSVYEISCQYNTCSLNHCDPTTYPRMFFSSIDNVFLQTHWHSGVRFTSAVGLE